MSVTVQYVAQLFAYLSLNCLFYVIRPFYASIDLLSVLFLIY